MQLHTPPWCSDESPAHGPQAPDNSRQDSTPQEALPTSTVLLRLMHCCEHVGLPARLMKSMEGFFSQARGQLDDAKNSLLERQWLDKVRVVSASQPLLAPKIVGGVFEQVSNALYANQWLDVTYKNAAGNKTIARVMPLGLAQQGPRMHLVCRYEGYDNERCLALHRIRKAEATIFTFERPKDFNLKQFDNDGRFGYGDGSKVKVSFRIDKAAGLHVVECPLSADQVVVELGDVYEITATVVDSDMLD